MGDIQALCYHNVIPWEACLIELLYFFKCIQKQSQQHIYVNFLRPTFSIMLHNPLSLFSKVGVIFPSDYMCYFLLILAVGVKSHPDFMCDFS